MQDVLDPGDLGYDNTQDGIYVPKMMNKSAAAPELLNELVFTCPPGSCATECQCPFNGQSYTAACNSEAQCLDELSENTLACAHPLSHIVICDGCSDSDSDDN